ncbi:RDD family protein [Spiractinospora alimapuensis]|nr:RDD family protein [Spiractinospora alimapuensis]
MPRDGTGAVASVPRRLGALAVDWLLSLGVAHTVFDGSANLTAYVALVVFAAQATLLITFTGTTIGKRIFGIRMGQLPASSVTWPLAVLVRTLLLCLVIPAVVYDRDNRGLHDRAVGTVSTRI